MPWRQPLQLCPSRLLFLSGMVGMQWKHCMTAAAGQLAGAQLVHSLHDSYNSLKNKDQLVFQTPTADNDKWWQVTDNYDLTYSVIVR